VRLMRICVLRSWLDLRRERTYDPGGEPTGVALDAGWSGRGSWCPVWRQASENVRRAAYQPFRLRMLTFYLAALGLHQTH